MESILHLVLRVKGGGGDLQSLGAAVVAEAFGTCESPESVKEFIKNYNGPAKLPSEDSNIIEFNVLGKPGPNYLACCIGHIPEEEATAIDYRSIRDYTSQYTARDNPCYLVWNLALAADAPSLYEISRNIRELKYCCERFGGFHGTTVRFMNLTPNEVEVMQNVAVANSGKFFMPGFFSTSTMTGGAPAFQDKDTHITVEIPPGYACALQITKEMSIYHDDEQEVLLACYTRFELLSVTPPKDGKKRMIHLKAITVSGSDDSVFILSKKSLSATEHVLTWHLPPDFARCIYIAAEQTMGLEAKNALAELDNKTSPAKLAMALEFCSLNMDHIGFYGDHGYEVTCTPTEYNRMHALYCSMEDSMKEAKPASRMCILL